MSGKVSKLGQNNGNQERGKLMLHFTNVRENNAQHN